MSAERLVALAAATPGPVYLRLSRPKTPVIYGRRRDVRRSAARRSLRAVAKRRRDGRRRRRHGVRGAQGPRGARGAPESRIRVIDAYSVQPIDRDGDRRRWSRDERPHHHRRGSLRAWRTRRRRERGRVGPGLQSEAPGRARDSAQRHARRALDRYGISARAIVAAVKSMISTKAQGPGPKAQAGIRAQETRRRVACRWCRVRRRERRPCRRAEGRIRHDRHSRSRWSPDGKRLAATWFDAIWTMTAGRPDAKRLVTKPDDWISERDPDVVA